MAVEEDRYKVVRLQILDEFTGEPLDYVNVRTNAKSVNMSDGTFLEDVIKTMTTKLNSVIVSEAKTSTLLLEHLNSSLHVDPEIISDAFVGLEYDKTTGVITFIRYDGTRYEWDTMMEKIALDVQFDKATNELVFTMDSGKETRVNVSKLADLYEGKETDTTKTSVAPDNTITVDILEKGIQTKHLSDEVKKFLTDSNDFINKYAEKLEGIEEGANKYILPKTTSEVLGGMKVGPNMKANEDGVVTAANITYGTSKDTAEAVNLYLEVSSIGGPSTDPIPTLETGKSYITSEGNIIKYLSTGLYDYIDATTNYTTLSGLTEEEVTEKLYSGLELIDLDTIAWCHDAERNYAVTASGDGFKYELDRYAFLGYIYTEEYVELINSGTLVDGKSEALESLT